MRPRPPLEVADIFRPFAAEYLRSHDVSREQKRVLKDIQLCRTRALGGHVEACDGCGHRGISYNSCRNRHCPKCQASTTGEWFEARASELLPVTYFHVVFTIPEEIRPLALQNKRTVYGILFRAAAETLQKVARDPKHLGAKIGFFGILHTWGQAVSYHPHVHFIVPGGGLSEDNSKWIRAPKDDFFLPIDVLKIVFRGKFFDYLERAFHSGELSFHGSLRDLADPRRFKRLLRNAAKHRPVISVKPPFAGPEVVLKYLARYTHRVAISNARLISLHDRTVTFRWKDYADGNRHKSMSLDVFEFMRRFLLHVLPRGFMRIRYYGFLANRNRKENLQLCRQLLPQDNPPPDDCTEADECPEVDDDKGKRCPACKKGHMLITEEIEPLPSRVQWRLATIQHSLWPFLLDTS